ncbi:Vesicle-fusing ATPase [Camellia lanceoleosa]|uniref:Vesicle-fusing ATPase n=1 Tax=Camellia lanceoleosa TaxID=1840588 RepID=A0ACC0HNB5_9ERIC|nr:Vesicle-fusing ATPase [Camellia lanceoleosa]
MLLYGPPGSGKTLVARSIWKLLNAKEPLIINGPDVLNAFQGVSERKIRSLFKAANEDENRYGAKSDLHIIIFDEIDSIAKFQDGKGGNDSTAVQLSNLTEVLHIKQDIARLKKDSAYFQATLACYKEDTVKLDKELVHFIDRYSINFMKDKDNRFTRGG